MTTHAPLFNKFLDDFFAAYYRRRPVNATFIGVHDHNHELPDFSENGSGDTLAEMQTLLTRLLTLPPEPLTIAENLDRTLAEGYLRTQIWEYQSEHFQRGNPTHYTSDGVFGVMVLFLDDFSPESGSVQAAIARMNWVPRLLEQAKDMIRSAPAGWVDKAIEECTGAQAFFTGGIDILMQQHGIKDPLFKLAADQAVKAYAEYKRHLETVLKPKANQNYACGTDAFQLMMRYGHFIDPDLDEMVSYAEEQIRNADDYLNQHARDFGAATPAAALAKLADLHPTTAGYYPSFTKVWNAVRENANRNRLVTWPEYPIEYIPQPIWARQAAPHLYFINYRTPPAFNRKPRHHYLTPHIDAGMPQDQQEKLLRANNDSTIKLNHVVHHGSIGHHVQNANAYQAESRIGRMAACDCSLRLAMFSSGTMAEGWAVYSTLLMNEFGFLTPLEAYSEHQGRRRMSARTVVDIRLHRGEFSLEQGAAYYQEVAGMGRDAANKEAIKNSMFPGAAMMYLFGSDRIRSLREEMSSRLGGDFDLQKFHDRFLSYGSIPVELVAAEMKREVNNVE